MVRLCHQLMTSTRMHNDILAHIFINLAAGPDNQIWFFLLNSNESNLSVKLASVPIFFFLLDSNESNLSVKLASVPIFFSFFLIQMNLILEFFTYSKSTFFFLIQLNLVSFLLLIFDLCVKGFFFL